MEDERLPQREACAPDSRMLFRLRKAAAVLHPLQRKDNRARASLRLWAARFHDGVEDSDLHAEGGDGGGLGFVAGSMMMYR